MMDNISSYKENLSKYFADRDVISLSSLLDDIDASLEGESADIREKAAADISEIINEYAKTLCIHTDAKFQIL